MPDLSSQFEDDLFYWELLALDHFGNLYFSDFDRRFHLLLDRFIQKDLTSDPKEMHSSASMHPFLVRVLIFIEKVSRTHSLAFSDHFLAVCYHS